MVVGGHLLGWQTTSRGFLGRGARLLWHNAGTGGYRSFIGLNLQNGTAVVVLSNSENSVDEVGLDLLNALDVR